MIWPFHTSFLAPTKKFRRLSVMLAINDQSDASQHKIAQITHLSSSMVNNYVKDLHDQGLIRITGATNRTQKYYLTETGHNELISLLLLYSAEIVQLYGGVKRELGKRLKGIAEEGIKKITLFGAAETAEVVLAAIEETELEVVGVVDSDPSKQGKRFHDFVIKRPDVLPTLIHDAVVITSFGRLEEIHKELRSLIGGASVRIIKLSEV